MQTLDLTIIICFLAAMAGYGIWQGQSNKTTGDYFLGGRLFSIMVLRVLLPHKRSKAGCWLLNS